MATEQGKTCFVICPIGDQHADLGKPERIIWEDSINVWEKVIEPACRQINIEPIRADRISRGGEIPEQVCRHVRDADIMIADLTGGNANVMYELGLRHTLLKPTIQIGERGRLPFDVAAIRTIMFMRTEGGLIEARNQLKEALVTALSEGSDPVTATRVWNDVDKSAAELAPTMLENPETAAQDATDEPGFLEKLAASEEAVQELSSTLSGITELVEQIGIRMSESSEEVRQADHTGGGAGARLAIAERTARKLDDIAERLEEGIGKHEALIARVSPGMDYILDRLEEGLEHEEWPSEFIDTMLHYGEILEGNQPSMEEFVGTLKSVGGATRSLRRTTSRLATGVRRMIDSNEVQLGWVGRLRGITGSEAK